MTGRGGLCFPKGIHIDEAGRHSGIFFLATSVVGKHSMGFGGFYSPVYPSATNHMLGPYWVLNLSE